MFMTISIPFNITYPVLLVDVFVGVPLSGQERMFSGNDFSVEKRRQRRILLRQAFDLQVST